MFPPRSPGPDPQALRAEAQARVAWGHPSHLVRKSLLDRGVSTTQADAWIGEAQRERDAEFRALGVRDTVLGGAIAAVAGLALFAYTRQAVYLLGVAGGLAGGGIAGALLLTRGVARMIAGSKGEGPSSR